MNKKEYSGGWRDYRKEKICRTLVALASTLTCKLTPRAKQNIHNAIWNAAKVLAVEMQLESKSDTMGSLTRAIKEGVIASPKNTEKFVFGIAFKTEEKTAR